MNNFSEFIASMLSDIVKARHEADKAAAQISLAYAKDEILKYFSVPRLEIEDLTIELSVGFAETEGGKGTTVIIDAEKLNALNSQCLSRVTLKTRMHNYQWSDAGQEGERKQLVNLI